MTPPCPRGARPARFDDILVLYRDPDTLSRLGDPDVLDIRPGLVVELSAASRLRGRRVIDRPLVFAELEGRPRERVMAAIVACTRPLLGAALYICHADDAIEFMGHLGDVGRVIRLWEHGRAAEGGSELSASAPLGKLRLALRTDEAPPPIPPVEDLWHESSTLRLSA